MGLGFVILFHFIVLFVISSLIGGIGGLATYFVSSKNRRKRKVLLALFIPFQGLYTLYVLALIGSMIVSGIKNIDIGIGDTWYAPLNETCNILMIDSPESASLLCADQSIVHDISHIQQIHDKVYGKTLEGEYFTYDLTSTKFRTYATDIKLIEAERIGVLDLIETSEFYGDRRSEVAGTALTIVGVLSLALTILVTFLTSRLVLYGWKLRRRTDRISSSIVEQP